MLNPFAWLARWEVVNGGVGPETRYVPAVGAVGYYPKVNMAPPAKAKPDFSRAPQLNWWLEDKKRGRGA